MVLQYIFLKTPKAFKVNIFKVDKLWDAREMFSFLPLMNNSVITGFSFLLLSISAIIPSKTIKILRPYLDCILQCFYKYYIYIYIYIYIHMYHSSIQ